MTDETTGFKSEPLVIANLHRFNLYATPPKRDSNNKIIPSDKIVWSAMGGFILRSTVFRADPAKPFFSFSFYTEHLSYLYPQILKVFTSKDKGSINMNFTKDVWKNNKPTTSNGTLICGKNAEGICYMGLQVDDEEICMFPFLPIDGAVIEVNGKTMERSELSVLLASSYIKNLFKSAGVAQDGIAVKLAIELNNNRPGTETSISTPKDSGPSKKFDPTEDIPF